MDGTNEELELIEKHGLLNGQFNLSEQEKSLLKDSAELFNKGFANYSLIPLWNAAISNLKRRAEYAGTEYFFADAASLKYHENKPTLTKRWSDIKDYDVIETAFKVGLISEKCRDVLRTVLNVRNLFSGAHPSEEMLSKEDLIAYLLLLSSNLFETQFPEPILGFKEFRLHIESGPLDESKIALLQKMINSYGPGLIRALLGYSKSKIESGKSPDYDNVQAIFPSIWERTEEHQRLDFAKSVADYQMGIIEDGSKDKGAAERLYEILLKINGARYLSEDMRIRIFEKMATNLEVAKNTYYGWSLETQVAKGIAQVGCEAVPKECFDLIYSRILAVWCGNGWGRSNAYFYLNDFIFSQPAKIQVKIATLFKTNKFAQMELFLPNPNRNAIELLDKISNNLTNEMQKAEILKIKEYVLSLRD